MKSSLRPYRAPLRPIAAALVSIFALVPQQTIAATVTSCDDSGAGTLRQAVMDAASSDVIDMTQLNCTISLTTGAIGVSQDSLTISGPGSDKLTIDGSKIPPPHGLILHSGTGALEIDHLTIEYGFFYSVFPDKYEGGGCVSSSGNLTISYATLYHCIVSANNGAAARGGGAFASGNLTVSHSVITGNTVYGVIVNNVPDYSAAQGGGLFARGALRVDHSTISRNYSALDGGAIFAPASAVISYSSISMNTSFNSTIASLNALTIDHSTISGNTATFAGVYATTPKDVSAQPVTISNSTISGNSTGVYGYGMRVPAVMATVPVTISNSTIAFNSGLAEAAVYLRGASAQLNSSIIADNVPADLGAPAGVTISGANNLVVTTSAMLAPGVVAIAACPQLEVLRDNGGPTLTHALRHTSPAIDSGANPGGVSYDQRGPGFQRAYGTRADIGAFEWQGGVDETIFSDGFDPPGPLCDH